MQIKTNPNSQRSFAKFIREFSSKLAAEEMSIEIGVQNLGDTWRDRQYREFAVALSEATRELDKFYKQADSYARYLERKAAAADRFLQGR